MGKPISSARWEIGAVANVMEYYGGAANKLMGETIPVSKPGFDFTLREPIGVVGLIVPWNFPLMLASWKIGPALAAGNTAILKPASYTPLTAIRVAELALEAGFPPGVLNVVTGPGGTAGAAIAAHPGIGKVAFTGETGTGQEIMRAGRRQREEDQPGARRQEPQRRLRRRGPRAFRGRGAVFGLRQLRPGLLRPVPDHRRALRPRPSRRAARRGNREGQSRRSRRPRHRSRHDGQFPAARNGARLHPDWAGGRRASCGRRRNPGRTGVLAGRLRPADRFRQRHVGHAHRPGGDLRAGRRGHPVRHRGGGVRLANATPFGLSGSIWTRDIGKASGRRGASSRA